MNTFKIYLAGGMGNLTWEEQTIWRDKVEDILNRNRDSYKYNLDIVNPTLFYNFKEKKHDSELEIMKYDIRHVLTSKLIIVYHNDPYSIGTNDEMMAAYLNNIPIISINPNNAKLHPWTICKSDKIFTSITDCVNYIMEFYLT